MKKRSGPPDFPGVARRVHGIAARRLFRACAVGAPLFFNQPARSAFDVFVDLNTYSKSAELALGVNAVTATTALSGADGVWLIEGNSGGISSNSSGFTLTDWRSMIGNIAGPNALVSTEDNPPSGTNYQNPSYTATDQIIGVTGMGTGTTGYTYLDAMCYNETGSTVGGTLLTSSQITGEAGTHGGTVAVLTRGYDSSGWTTPTNADLADSRVTAAVMETNTLSENITGFVQASYLTGKRTYVYISSQYEDDRVIPWIYDLKQQDPAAMASSNTSIILTNGYNRTDSTNDYSWYGGDGTVQDSVKVADQIKTLVPVNTFVWTATASGNVSAAANWAPENIVPGHVAVAAASGTSPMNTYDAFSFTSSAVTGSITATIDTTTAKGLAVYFSGSASYTLASGGSGDVLSLTGYGTLGATGDVGYGVNVVPIVVQGAGSDVISAPIVLEATNTSRLTIDQQDTSNPFSISGPITTNGLPMTVQGSGMTAISGQVIGTTALTKTGSGTLQLGGSSGNTGLIATVSAGTINLNASGAGPAAAAIADITSGATVNITGTAANELLATYAGANLTINSGGTFDLNGQNVQVTAIAGSNGVVTNSSATPVTLTIGANNQSGTFGGSITNGSGAISLLKIDAGTQTFLAANSYIGTTTINGGTIALSGAGTIASGNLIFNGTSTVNLGGTTQTFSNVSAGTSTSPFTATLTGGALTITGASGFHFIPMDSSGTTTLDASGLARLTFNQPTQSFEVSSPYASTAQGGVTMDLPTGKASSTSITAQTLFVGDTYHASAVPLSTLNLGQSTTLNLGSGGLAIAGYNANGAVTFASGLSNPTLQIRGLTGGATAAPLITLGNNNTGGNSSVAKLNLSGGSVNAIVTTLNLAALGTNNNQTTTGTFTIGAGTLNTGTITFGSGTAAASGAKVISTLTQNAGTVLAGTLNFSDPAASSAGVYTGIYNLGENSATPSAATLLARSVLITYPDATGSSQTINFNNGTIGNYDDAGIPGGNGTVSDLMIGGRTGGGAAGNSSTLTINLLNGAGTTTHYLAAEAGRSITVTSTAIITGAGGLTTTGAGTVNLDGTDTYTGGTFVNNGTLQLANAAAFPTDTNLSIGAASVVLANHGGSAASAISVSNLTLAGTASAWTGKLDLTNNAMVVGTGSSVLATVTDQIRDGFNGGAWNGAGGILSSTAAGNSAHLTALGGIQNDQNGSAIFTASHPFDSITPGTSDVLVKYTYYGDANLDGQVDGSDYTLIDHGFLTHATGWLNGDFNYDGVIDGSDYSLIDNAFNTQGASLAAIIATPTAIISSSVPEPASLGVVGIVALGFLARRRRVTFIPESTAW